MPNRSRVLGYSYPNGANSRSYHPAPMPRSNRPPLTRSMVVAILATWAGCRNGAQATSVPSRTRSVAVAKAARAVKGSTVPEGSGDPPYRSRSRKKWSEIHTESNPSASARRAASASRDQDSGSPSGKEKS